MYKVPIDTSFWIWQWPKTRVFEWIVSSIFDPFCCHPRRRRNCRALHWHLCVVVTEISCRWTFETIVHAVDLVLGYRDRRALLNGWMNCVLLWTPTFEIRADEVLELVIPDLSLSTYKRLIGGQPYGFVAVTDNDEDTIVDSRFCTILCLLTFCWQSREDWKGWIRLSSRVKLTPPINKEVTVVCSQERNKGQFWI
jgi:hypothetical protein